MAGPKIELFTFWRSQAAYRVRIALHLKGLAFEPRIIDLLKGDQYSDQYRALNPESVVPTLVIDGRPLYQSLVILEYLDEEFPEPPLLPSRTEDRAHARALAQIVAMDGHPLIVPRIRSYLGKELKLDEAQRMEWIRHWMDTASDALESVLSRDSRTGTFCVGDRPTQADICLVAHFTSTIMLYKNDVTRWPTANRIFQACMQEEAFAATHPLRQPDAGQEGAH